MGRFRLGVGAAVLVTVLAGSPAAVAAPTAIAGSLPTTPLAPAVRVRSLSPPVAPMLRDMLDRVNAERSARGLGRIRLDDRLVLVAQHHADEQARQGMMSHTGIDGSTLALRVDRVGYRWRTIAENVAFGSTDAATVFAGWMASADHRSNILSAYVDTGIGLAYGADGRPYWSQVFGSPR